MPTERRQWSRGRPLTAVEVEELLIETLDLLEEATEDLAQVALDQKASEAKYRIAYARTYLSSTRKTDVARQQEALKANENLLQKRGENDAKLRGAEELCRTRRADLETLRTIAANARSAETGRA